LSPLGGRNDLDNLLRQAIAVILAKPAYSQRPACVSRYQIWIEPESPARAPAPQAAVRAGAMQLMGDKSKAHGDGFL